MAKKGKTPEGGHTPPRADRSSGSFNNAARYHKHDAPRKEDLLHGGVWEDEQTGRCYFTLQALTAFIEKRGNPTRATREDMTRWIKGFGGGAETLTINGVSVDCWWMPRSFVDDARWQKIADALFRAGGKR